MKSAFSNISKKTLFFIQIVFVITIFIFWFGFESVREARSLWILLLCAFPANFISGIIPYDPMIIYFAKYHPQCEVVLVSVVSILLVEGMNYSVLSTISQFKYVIQVREKRIVKKVIDLFYRAPILSLLIAGFFPLPYYPFRILVILSNYPFLKYILAIVISKTLRISCLVLIGQQLNIPDHFIFLIFIGIIIIIYTTIFIQSFFKKICDHDKSNSQS